MCIKEIVLIGKNRKNISYQIYENGCWICISHAYDKDGYPLFMHPITKKLVHIHRYMYEQKFGDLGGLFCCHTCDTPACINPDHLFLGTPKDNAVDCLNKGRHTDKRGEKHHLAKLTSNDVFAIRKDNRPLNQIALEYKVSWACIYDVKKRRRWSHL
jgi:hypothetical protein